MYGIGLLSEVGTFGMANHKRQSTSTDGGGTRSLSSSFELTNANIPGMYDKPMPQATVCSTHFAQNYCADNFRYWNQLEVQQSKQSYRPQNSLYPSMDCAEIVPTPNHKVKPFYQPYLMNYVSGSSYGSSENSLSVSPVAGYDDSGQQANSYNPLSSPIAVTELATKSVDFVPTSLENLTLYNQESVDHFHPVRESISSLNEEQTGLYCGQKLKHNPNKDMLSTSANDERNISYVKRELANSPPKHSYDCEFPTHNKIRRTDKNFSDAFYDGSTNDAAFGNATMFKNTEGIGFKPLPSITASPSSVGTDPVSYDQHHQDLSSNLKVAHFPYETEQNTPIVPHKSNAEYYYQDEQIGSKSQPIESNMAPDFVSLKQQPCNDCTENNSVYETTSSPGALYNDIQCSPQATILGRATVSNPASPRSYESTCGMVVTPRSEFGHVEKACCQENLSS